MLYTYALFQHHMHGCILVCIRSKCSSAECNSIPEVELPYTELPSTGRELAVSIGKGQAELNELQHVYIAPEEAQVVGLLGLGR